MTYWKIEYLEEHLKLETENGLNKNTTITQDYLIHLKTQLKLMKESYEQGKKDALLKNKFGGKK